MSTANNAAAQCLFEMFNSLTPNPGDMHFGYVALVLACLRQIDAAPTDTNIAQDMINQVEAMMRSSIVSGDFAQAMNDLRERKARR